MVYSSIAEIPEGELVTGLLRDPYWLSTYFRLDGFPENPVIRVEVELAAVPGNVEGEVDVLLADPARPDQAIAIQVKRIKFDARDIERGSPKKLQEIKKAYEQANRDVKVGFSQVYLYVIAVVDSRELNIGKKHPFEGISNAHRDVVRQGISLAGLDARVGVFQVELAQTIDNPPLHPSTFHGELRRKAQPVAQNPELTEWVKQRLAEGPTLKIVVGPGGPRVVTGRLAHSLS